MAVLCSVAINDCEKCDTAGETCSKCKDGFYFFESKADGIFDRCVRCDEPGLLIQGENCKRCDAVFPRCQICQENQSSSESPIECKACILGYALREKVGDIYTKCEKCLLGEYEKVTVTGESFCDVCANSIAGCLECTNQGKDCTKCSEATSLFLDENNRNICVDCTEAIYYKKGVKTPQCEGQCCLCTQAIENCLECKGDIHTCSRCHEGYLLHSSKNDGVFDSCVPCKEPHQIRNERQLLTSGLAVCDHCSTKIANCKDCYGNADICLVCNQGFYRTASTPAGNYDSCTPCTQDGFYKQGDSNGLGYCLRCLDLIPGCQSCDGKTCAKCLDPLFLSLPFNESCVECLGQDDSRSIDELSGLAVCNSRPVVNEIIGFVSKDQSMASITLGCSEAGLVSSL